MGDISRASPTTYTRHPLGESLERRLPFRPSVGIIVSMSELPPPTIPAPPAKPSSNVGTIVVLVVLAVTAFFGYKAYESKQDTERFRQEEVGNYGRALRGD